MRDSASAGAVGAVEALEAEDLARARWYSFFSRWFLAPPDQQALDLFVMPQAGTSAEAGSPESGLGEAWRSFADGVRHASLARMRTSYDETFISVGEAPVSLHACVYLTGFSNERPLAEIRQWLAGHGIRSTRSGLLTEDHFGVLCEVMAWLIIGDGDATARDLEAGAADEAQQHLFQRFIAPACEEFCQRLHDAPDAGIYRELGRLFAAFTAVERQAFEIER